MGNFLDETLFVIYYIDNDGGEDFNLYLKEDEEYTDKINDPDIMIFEREEDADSYRYIVEEDTTEEHFVKQI